MKQISLVEDFIDTFKNSDTAVIVDPVLGDNGMLYKNFTVDFAKEMAKLCSKADVITPNLTEAAYLLGKDYVGEGYSEEYIRDTLRKLSALGAEKVVLTGVSYDKKSLGVATYDSASGEYGYIKSDKINSMFHGTGDVWASTFAGAFTKGMSFTDAVKVATEFTVEAIKATLDDKDEHWYGVKFESCLNKLTSLD